MIEKWRLRLGVDLAEHLALLAERRSAGDWTARAPVTGGETAQVLGMAATIRTRLARNGFVIVALGPQALRDGGLVAAGMANLIIQSIADPIRVFGRIASLWKALSVDLARPPDRSGGIGRLPLHQDFVNATNPPDVVCIYCANPDPLGGGQTIIAPLNGIERELDADVASILSHRAFVDGTVRDLENVGDDINPFAVLNPGAVFPVRYTGHLLGSEKSPERRRALDQLADRLAARAVARLLDVGDLCLIDQRRALHGRLPLGGSQSMLPPHRRRRLMLSYARYLPNGRCND